MLMLGVGSDIMKALALVWLAFVVSAESQTTTTAGAYEPCSVCNPGLTPTDYDAELPIGVSTYISGVTTCRDAQHLGNLGGIPPAECVLLRFQSPHACGCTEESLVTPTVPTAPVAPLSSALAPSGDPTATTPTTLPPILVPRDGPASTPTPTMPTFTPTLPPASSPIRDIVVTITPTASTPPRSSEAEPSFGDGSDDPVSMPSAAPIAVPSPTVTTLESPPSGGVDPSVPPPENPPSSLDGEDPEVASPTMATADSPESPSDGVNPETTPSPTTLTSTGSPLSSSDAADPGLDTEGNDDGEGGDSDDGDGEILNLRPSVFYAIAACVAAMVLLCLTMICRRVCCATAPVSPSNDITVVAPPKEEPHDVEQPLPPSIRQNLDVFPAVDSVRRGDGLVRPSLASELAIAIAQAGGGNLEPTDGSTATSLSSLRSDMMSRKVNAPPGKMGLTIDTTLEGARIQSVSATSPLFGQVFKGDMILSINNVDTRGMPGAALSALIVKTAGITRELVVISEDVVAPEKIDTPVIEEEVQRAASASHEESQPAVVQELPQKEPVAPERIEPAIVVATEEVEDKTDEDAPTMPIGNPHQAPIDMTPDTPPARRKLIMLCTSILMNRRIKNQQERAQTALDAHDIPYDVLDGVTHPELRDELWGVSPLERGVYPQFFWVDLETGKPTFWGDFDVFSLANDNGQLVEEFGGGAR